MSYANQYLKTPFNYAEIAKKHNLAHINPDGTCFAITCDWIWVLTIDAQNAASAPLLSILQDETPRLAIFHADHVRRVDTAQSAHAKMKEYVASFDRFYLKIANLDPQSGAVVGASSEPPFSDADWMGCSPGDMWCVLGKYLRESVSGGALLNMYEAPIKADSKKGHAIGVYVQSDRAIRLFDMNAGEFLLKDQTAWQAWARDMGSFYNPVVYRHVDVFALEHK